MDSRKTLKHFVIEELPPGFVRALLEQITEIYPRSYTAMTLDPGLGEDEAKYVLGYYRRGLAETSLKRAAAEFGLEITVVQPEGGGCKHTFVRVGRFGLTICHVPKAAGFPQHSDAREQSAQVNEYLSQADFFPIDVVANDSPVYGVLVHTEEPGDKGTFHSMHLGFPNAEYDGWLEEPINLLDVVDVQRKLFQLADDPLAQIQSPTPVWKPTTKLKSDGEESA